jgi:hypothetical protein
MGAEPASDATIAIINQVAVYYGQRGLDSGFNWDIVL